MSRNVYADWVALVQGAVDTGSETFRGLEEKTGIPFATIASWTRKKAVPPLDRAAVVAEALGRKLTLE